MSRDFEEQLRSALRPVDPDDGFDARLLERIAKQPRRPRFRGRQRWAATLAASFVFAALGVHGWQVRREQEGLEARKQLIEALRLTGEQLDRVYQAVNRGPPRMTTKVEFSQ